MGRTTGIAYAAALLLASSTSASILPVLSQGRSYLWDKRADSTTIPAAISIPPSQYWEGDDGAWSTFAVQVGVGSHAQTVRTLVGTSVTTLITVAADESACPAGFVNCQTLRGSVFNPNNSLTWVENSKYDTGVEESLGLNFAAVAGYDTVTLGYMGSGGPTVPHTAIFNIGSLTLFLGVLGLSPYPTNFSSYTDPQPSLLNSLATNNTIPSMSIGYTAGNQYRLNNLKVYGSLVLGGYDQNRFQATNITFPMYSDISKDLSVTLHSITTDSGSPSNLLPGGTIQVFIDSTTAQIWLPESACAAFEQAFGITYNTTVGLYYVSAAQHQSLVTRNPNVTFTIGGTQGGSTVDITLPYGAFDLNATFPNAFNPNTTYYFPLQRAANNTQYTLGRAFLQEAYLIADYDRGNFTVAPCVWDQGKVTSERIVSIRRANETGSDTGSGSSSSGISGGAIAGIVIGIIAVVAIIALILFFMRRRKTGEKRRLAELEAAAAGGSKHDSEAGSEGKPFIGGGELAGGEIHELTAPHLGKPQELDSPYGVDPNKAGYSEMDGGEHYAPGKHGNPAEMESANPIYEMAGSDVHEMPAPQPGRDIKY